jgi:ATPase subunit of ABC transporter with duplicated ATPase domains
MIRLDNISKQNGHQILFIDASMGIQKGEKVGLVGPNGAGKGAFRCHPLATPSISQTSS